MPTRETLLLQPDRPLRLHAVRQWELHVEAGIVWITSGAAADLFLVAGDSYRLPCAGVVLVEAVRGPAVVRLESEQRSRVSALVESLRKMLPKGLATP
ncbi:DUF2917 domain-containing protein [Sulfuritalea sp.]|uniref:DUF2917 domain-containing protein n=1 Tax=Sulfuritalea sp. TaxID=2480090 RepID=UPI001ACBA887|nr:DUF2917 domain-containing protein [Sulfuritalea sp.]MBN8474242.1 DUF2917 domain-containing protein [Sulfuritalea sp.]